MKLFHMSASIVLPLLLLTACGQSPNTPGAGNSRQAEPADVSSKDYGQYVLHFNATSTDHLTAEVAQAYKIVRSRNRALLTLAINKKQEGTTGIPVPGNVSVRAANLTGQAKNLTLREIREEDAVYYIGDLAVANGETLIFEVDATPENETRPLQVKFSRQFYSN